MKYAGFWKRFKASWIDFFILLLPLIFLSWSQTVSRTLAFVSLFLGTFIFYIYEIYFHGNSGQTIGKKSQNIKVVTLTGNPISWKQAFLRSSIGLGLSMLASISLMTAIFRITDEEFSLLNWTEMSERQNQMAPFLTEINIAMQVWAWSEIFVVLFNQKRRALHDFIAGTVVIDQEIQSSELLGNVNTETANM